MIDAIIDNYKTSERDLAIRHLQKLKEYGLKNDLILFCLIEAILQRRLWLG